MKISILSILIIFLSFTLQAGKEQQLSITVLQSKTTEPAAGVTVQLLFPKCASLTAITDENGECNFSWKKGSPTKVNISDPQERFLPLNSWINGKNVKKDTNLLFAVEPRIVFDRAYHRARDAYYDSLNANGGIYGSFGNEACDALDTMSSVSAMQAIYTEVRYPQEAIQLGIQGKVYVEFIIEKDGTVTHVEVIRGVHELLDTEALRVVYSLPKIKTSTCDGEPVRYKARLPLIFTID